jgi:glucose-1-phosphate thymidylyltransferase
MIAIILCAGFGTRMYPLTRNQPKSLLPVAGKPVLDYLADQLVGLSGLEAVHLISNALFFGQFEQWRRQWEPEFSSRGIAVHLYNDGITSDDRRLGAGGDLAFVMGQLDLPDGALIAAGDNILQFELHPIWESFRTSRKNTVIAIFEEDSLKLRRTGVLKLDGDRVVGLAEKPAAPPSRWSCPPFYFLNRAALEQLQTFLSQRRPPDAMGHLIQYLVDKVPVYAVRVNGGRLDIGATDTYAKANQVLGQNRRVPPGTGG